MDEVLRSAYRGRISHRLVKSVSGGGNVSCMFWFSSLIKCALIYADPPWKWGHFGEAAVDSLTDSR